MAAASELESFTLDIDELEWTGHDLQRPESVAAEPDGTLWASDGRGGVTRIDPDGGQAFLGGWGSLAMPRLPTFRAPVPGLPMSHWR
jgi:streptogramin lyase